jgi:hypothetical protein
MTAADSLYTLLRGLAEAGKPMPVVGTICDAIGASHSQYSAALKELITDGRLRLQRKMGQATEARRVMFPDGVCTPWTVPPKGSLMTYSAAKKQPGPERRPVTPQEQQMIEAAVEAGKVKRLPPVYQGAVDDFYRRVGGP